MIFLVIEDDGYSYTTTDISDEESSKADDEVITIYKVVEEHIQIYTDYEWVNVD